MLGSMRPVLGAKYRGIGGGGSPYTFEYFKLYEVNPTDSSTGYLHAHELSLDLDGGSNLVINNVTIIDEIQPRDNDPSNGAADLFDGEASTGSRWVTQEPYNVNAWFEAQVTSGPITANRLGIQPQVSVGREPNSWKLAVSTDGVTWQDVLTVSNANMTVDAQWYYFDF